MLCILTSKLGVCTLLAGQNNIFQHFNIFSLEFDQHLGVNQSLRVTPKHQRLDVTLKCWLTPKCWSTSRENLNRLSHSVEVVVEVEIYSAFQPAIKHTIKPY